MAQEQPPQAPAAVEGSDRPGGQGPAPSSPQEGAPRAPDVSRCRRSLIVGLGTTGYRVVMDIRQRLIEKYRTLRNLPVAFVVLETDGQKRATEVPLGEEASPDLPLTEQEWLHFTVEDMDQIKANLAEWPHLRNWVPIGILQTPIVNGANNVRARGRLALFANFARVVPAIAQRWSTLRTETTGEQPPEIYVVGTLAGGTCSGSFIDLAYALRAETTPNVQVIGYFTTPGDSCDDSTLCANVYAALVELNHFTVPGAAYRVQFTQNSQPVSFTGQPPYDYPYIVGTHSPAAGITREQQEAMIGSDIFFQIDSGFESTRRAARADIKSAMGATDSRKCPLHHVTMGLAGIHFPAHKVMHACAARLAAAIIDTWRQPVGSPSVANLREQARLLIEGEQPGWSREAVIRRLLMTGTQTDIMGALDRWQSETTQKIDEWTADETRLHRLADDLENRETTTIRDAFRGHEDQVRPWDQHPANLGAHMQSLHSMLQQIVRWARDSGLPQVVRDRVAHPAHRHQFTRTFLEQLGLEFAARQKETADLAAEHAQAREGLEFARQEARRKVDRAVRSLLIRVSPGRREAIQEACNVYLQRALDYYSNELRRAVHDHAADFYRLMVERVTELTAELDRFAAKLDSLATDLEQTSRRYWEQPTAILGEQCLDTSGDDPLRKYYADHVAGDVVNQVAIAALSELSQQRGGPPAPLALYDLRNVRDQNVKQALFGQALEPFRAHRSMSIVTKWIDEIHQEPADQRRALGVVVAQARPYLEIVTTPDWAETALHSAVVISVEGGANPIAGAPKEMAALLQDHYGGQVGRSERVDPGADRYLLAIVHDRGGFPLRALRIVQRFEQHYRRELSSQTQPIHSRSDIPEWRPLDRPSVQFQKDLWRVLAAAWATGVVRVEHLPGRGTAFAFDWNDRGLVKPVETPPWLPSTMIEREVGGVKLTERVDDGELRDPNTELLPPHELADVVQYFHGDPEHQYLGFLRTELQVRLQRLGPTRFRAQAYTHINDMRQNRLEFSEKLERAIRAYVRDEPALGETENDLTANFAFADKRIELTLGDTCQAQVVAKGPQGQELRNLYVEWRIASPATGSAPVAISEVGEVTALGPGVAEIEATLRGRQRIFTDQATVVVVAPEAAVPVGAAPSPEGAVRCGDCGRDWPPGHRFCGVCGKPLAAAPRAHCTECGREWPPDRKFCGECGNPCRVAE